MVFKNGDVFGDGVNVASRLEAEAKENEILISGAVRREIKNKEGFNSFLIDEKGLKGVDEPIKIYKLLGEDEEYIPGLGLRKKSRIKPVIWALMTLFLIASTLFIRNYLESSQALKEKTDSSDNSINSIAIIPRIGYTVTHQKLKQVIV